MRKTFIVDSRKEILEGIGNIQRITRITMSKKNLLFKLVFLILDIS